MLTVQRGLNARQSFLDRVGVPWNMQEAPRRCFSSRPALLGGRLGSIYDRNDDDVCDFITRTCGILRHTPSAIWLPSISARQPCQRDRWAYKRAHQTILPRMRSQYMQQSPDNCAGGLAEQTGRSGCATRLPCHGTPSRHLLAGHLHFQHATAHFTPSSPASFS